MTERFSQSGHDGPERRSHPGHSLKWIFSLTTLAATAVSVGIAWGTAKTQLNHKIDVSDQQLVDANLEAQVQAITGQLNALKPQLDRIETRVSLIYCSNVPVSNRTGCQ